MDHDESKHKAMHPGEYVKQYVIPEGMTVKKAAELLRVGRPALSNFLNCNADLSKEMAVRLERTFGADSEHLIDLQARFDHGQAAAGKESIVSGVYAPELARIRAMEIQDWADRKKARHQLAALIRRLVHSTGRDLTRVDLPAFDNAEDRGLDGTIETNTPTPWIPSGRSVWQLTCRADIGKKAEVDYARGIELVPKQEWSKTTFVFVVARNWQEKKKWAKDKTEIGPWKEVRAYDASDVEQWLEQSAPTQIWLAPRVKRAVAGFRSIEECWREWSKDCKRPLSPKMFDSAVELHAGKFNDWLAKEPEDPFVVAADSRDEALAFLWCLGRSGMSGINRLNDRTIVIDTCKALERLDVDCQLPILAVISSRKAEARIGGLYRRCHCVIIRPSNSEYNDPDIVLDRLSFLDFHRALFSEGYDYDEIERLARETACSPTILRRRLSSIPEVRTPSWAGVAEIARKLVPAAMVGAWNSTTHGDRTVVLRLSRSDNYAILEENVTELLRLKDAPLWSAGDYRGVVSRTDALFGIASFVTKTDLDNFLSVANDVLCKDQTSANPTQEYELPAKSPEYAPTHSNAIHRGIREMLILLAVFGNRLFHKRLGFDAETEVTSFVENLLSPFEQDQITSYGAALPDFAEAAPEVILSLIETDVRKPKPVICELMKTPRHSFLSHSLRTPFLWTLQVLARNSQRFPRVVNILAKIREVSGDEREGNWSPKPQETLASFFDSWIPQTAATLDQRTQALEVIRRTYPAIGWSICIGQLDGSVLLGPNYRPRWRDDGQRSDRQIPKAEQRESVRRAMDFLVNWDFYDEHMLGDLVERLPMFSESSQLRIWDRIANWADSNQTDAAKASLRQRIKACAHLRHEQEETIAHPQNELMALKELLPSDIILRHAWLFKSHCVCLAPGDMEGFKFQKDNNEQRLYELRIDALREIWEERGFEGIHCLLGKSETTSDLIGELMAVILTASDNSADFIRLCVHAATTCDSLAHRSCLTGFITKTDPDLVEALICETEYSGQIENFTTLLLCMPFGTKTWRRLDDKSSENQNLYWKTAKPRTWSTSSTEEINESVGKLLAVGRTNAAFRAALVARGRGETSLLQKLLSALSRASPHEPLNDLMTDDYNVSVAFEELDRRTAVTIEEKARLEYANILRLDKSKHGIPNIEKHLSESPILFALAIACVYKRADGGEDPPGFWSGNREFQHGVARQAQILLNRFRFIPGTDTNGNIDAKELRAWLDAVRSWCERNDRALVGDHRIGELLANAPEKDGFWPCRPVCEVLESIESDEVDESFLSGALNRRGVYMRGKGGDKEREHAERYRTWSAELAEYPRVSRSLRRIATYYESEAGRQDIETELMRRLAH